MGGSNGSEYDNVLDHPVDLLFCLDNSQKLYLIPVVDIRASGNKKAITISQKSKWSKYQVII